MTPCSLREGDPPANSLETTMPLIRVSEPMIKSVSTVYSDLGYLTSRLEELDVVRVSTCTEGSVFEVEEEPSL